MLRARGMWPIERPGAPAPWTDVRRIQPGSQGSATGYENIVTVAPDRPHTRSPRAAVRDARLAVAAAVGAGFLAAYEICLRTIDALGPLAAVPITLTTFVVVAAVALVAVARLDAGVLGR